MKIIAIDSETVCLWLVDRMIVLCCL